jgi:hypothetical protein
MLSSIKGFKELLEQENEEEEILFKKDELCDKKLKNKSEAIISSLNNCINKIDYVTKKNIKYKIIRYDKNMLCKDEFEYSGLLRSVIINSDNKVVGYAPAKSIPEEKFIEYYPEKTSDIIAEEFVEGTMINLFWDETVGEWEFATKNTVGAEISFYKNSNINEGEKKSKSFRSMFIEAFEYCLMKFEYLDKKYCYSFVLQHPDNRIVVPVTYPQLYLVEVFEIDNKENENIQVYSMDMEIVKLNDNWTNTFLQFPQVYHNWKDYNDLKQQFGYMNRDYRVMGCVIKNKKTTKRYKIRNQVYEYVRHLKGNQAKLQYQYLCLRQSGKVRDYLKYYPENRKEFSVFRNTLHNFTSTLFQNYILCYIKKNKPLIEFPQQFTMHMFKLHKIYLDELKVKCEFMTIMIVINYVNNLPPSLLMYSLNYIFRQKNIDILKSESESESGTGSSSEF